MCSHFDGRSSCLANRWRLAVLPISLALAGWNCRALADEELISLSLEQLMDVTVSSASRFEQKISKVASAVTVITRDEIQQHGWRTLAEALRSVPGFYIHNDRNYDYIGMRGFARPQDFNSRILLLLDDQRINDPLYDQAKVGSEQLLDLDLVERIEVVRGPGSSVYGGNAIFGVINVITRTARQVDGFEAAAGWASHHTRSGRLSFGGRSENGFELLASFSGLHSEGPSLYFPELDSPATNNGRTSGTDFDYNERFFGRLSFGGWRLTAAASQRRKGSPNGSYGSNFNDPQNSIVDSQAFVDLSYQQPLTDSSEIQGRVYWSRYAYDWTSNYNTPPILNHDQAQANWWGSELKLLASWSPRNRLVSGIEYESSYHLNQWNYDPSPANEYFRDQRRSQRFGVFLQNDFQWTDAINLSLGARVDKVGNTRVQISPRLGVVYRSSPETIWKMQYGTAFRAPNTYESHYRFPGSQIDNPDLQPEKITTYEAGVAHYFSRRTRLSATLYHYKISQLIDQISDPGNGGLLKYTNSDPVNSAGVELEAEHLFQNGARLRTNLDLSQTRDSSGHRLTNSPRAIGKILVSIPLPWLGLQLGGEGQWMSSRKTWSGESVAGHGMVNLMLLKPQARQGWQFSAGIMNLFDRRHDDPTALDIAIPGRDRTVQNGRTFRVNTVLRF